MADLLRRLPPSPSRASIRHGSASPLGLWLCLLVGILLTVSVRAQQLGAEVHEIKAAMLYKFLSYVSWPQANFEHPNSPYRIWVLGATPVANVLPEIIAGRMINERPVEIFSARNTAEIQAAHVIFVAENRHKYIRKVAAIAQQQSALLVAELPEGIDDYSTINLRVIDGRLRFEVSLASAHANNLKVSARLLSVASLVKGNAQ